jgi:hypothetical protein
MGVLDSLNNAVQATKDAAEIAAFTSFGIPIVVATWFQRQRIALGLPQVTNPTSLFIIAFIMFLPKQLQNKKRNTKYIDINFI